MKKRLPNPGIVRCLGPSCDKSFRSSDKATNRLCPTCSRKNAKERPPRVFSTGGLLPNN